MVRSKSLSDTQLRCLGEVQRSTLSPIVFFESPELSRRHHELEREAGRQEARAWLRERGLIDSLPVYNPKTEGLAEYARRIEAFCRIEPGTMLMMHELGPLTVRPECLEQELNEMPTEAENDQFICLLNAIAASNLEEHGIGFGFIGNETSAETKES